VEAVLDAHRVDGTLKIDALIVVSELASNAVEAASGQPIDVTVEIVDDDGCIGISVVNPGGWEADPSSFVVPDGSLPRGRGLSIARAVSETLSIRSIEGRTVVDVRLRGSGPSRSD
jgi:anti-sigma regulatory factor (Ser/Thr protein kinase)